MGNGVDIEDHLLLSGNAACPRSIRSIWFQMAWHGADPWKTDCSRI